MRPSCVPRILEDTGTFNVATLYSQAQHALPEHSTALAACAVSGGVSAGFSGRLSFWTAVWWVYDLVQVMLHDGTGVRLLTIIDDYSREYLALRAARSIRSADVIKVLAEAMVFRGVLDHIRSDDGPEFTTRAMREWLRRVGVRTLYIDPGSPWENGYIESFDGKLRDELLGRGSSIRCWRSVTGGHTTGSGRTTLWATSRRCLRPSCLLTLFRCLSV